jgi:hypothetical protein
MSNFVEWCKNELEFLNTGDAMDIDMRKHLLHMCEEFAKEGHSGCSASYAALMLEKLFRYEPIKPLTGDDDEWDQLGGGSYQNKRCSRVFKDKDGRAYDIEGKLFEDKYGCTYSSRDSIVYITFPYTPTTEYVKDKD